MATKISYVVLIGVLLISCLEAGFADWTIDLERQINRMTQNINEQVAHLQSQIHQTVESSLQPALAEVSRVVESLPRDAHGRIISNGGNVISISSGNGVSRTVMSGHTPEGEPYVRDVEERYQGNILYHNETVFNPRTRATEKIRWKLDLATRGAKPEILTDEN